MKSAEERILSIVGECTCGEIYISRNLIAPDCVYHNYFYDLVKEMKDYATEHIKSDRQNVLKNIEINYDTDMGGNDYAEADPKSIIDAPMNAL